jgi:hypothetical protein
MALGYYFNPRNMGPDVYDEVIRRLEAAGAGAPPGRSYHCAFQGENGLDVFDVWDSEEQFNAFGETLMPILSELGVDPGQPHVAEVHNVIVGS